MVRVKVFTYEWLDELKRSVKVADGVASFHCWGMNYNEFDNGIGNFSTAIIERDDGTVESVPAEYIQFIKD